MSKMRAIGVCYGRFAPVFAAVRGKKAQICCEIMQ